MSRSIPGGLGLALFAAVCCIGVPLVLSGIGFTAIAALKGEFRAALVLAIVVIAVLGAYMYFRRREGSNG